MSQVNDSQERFRTVLQSDQVPDYLAKIGRQAMEELRDGGRFKNLSYEQEIAILQAFSVRLMQAYTRGFQDGSQGTLAGGNADAAPADRP